jgi:hypothetical protein
MKVVRTISGRLAFSAAISALCIGVSFADGNVLKSGNVDSMSKWYGRAGGLVGSDLIESNAKASTERVGITYDMDVAQRTNMPARDSSVKGDATITYDKDVAARTNMPRGEKDTSITAGGAAAEVRN